MRNIKNEFKDYIKFLNGFVKKYKIRIILCILISMISMFFMMLNPMVSKYIIDNVLILKNVSLLVKVIAVLSIVALVNAILHFTFSYTLNNVFLNIGNDLKKYIYEQIIGLDIDKSNKLSVGQMTYGLFTDTEILKSSFGQIIFGGIYNSILIILFVIYMLSMNMRLGIFVICGQSLQFFLLMYFPKRIKTVNYERKKKYEIVMTRTIEIFNSLYLLKSCSNENIELKKFNETIDVVKKKAIKENLLSLIFSEGSALITFIIQFGVMGYGGFLVANDHLTLGGLTAFIVVANMLNSPLAAIVSVTSGIQDSIASLKRILEILKLKNVESQNGIILNNKLQGNISIKNLSFNYDNKKEILKDINLELECKNIYSIIGKSGVGKTTLCMLLAKFYEPTCGSISIDDIDIKDISKDSFRENVGILLQNKFLFSGTVKENILLGKLDANDDEIRNAAVLANAHEFICNLPNGYDTQVGDKGNKLSGGQLQRIALARLFLQKPSVIILDEPTSFLDIESEELIKESIKELAKECTIIMITHKLDTAKIAHKVILIDEGTIKEIGTHEELVNYNYSLYNKVYKAVLG